MDNVFFLFGSSFLLFIFFKIKIIFFIPILTLFILAGKKIRIHWWGKKLPIINYYIHGIKNFIWNHIYSILNYIIVVGSGSTYLVFIIIFVKQKKIIFSHLHQYYCVCVCVWLIDAKCVHNITHHTINNKFITIFILNSNNKKKFLDFHFSLFSKFSWVYNFYFCFRPFQHIQIWHDQ